MEMLKNIAEAETETALAEAQEKMTPDKMEFLQNFLNSQSKTFANKTKAGAAVGWSPAKSANEHKKLLPIIQDKLEKEDINLDFIVQTLKAGLGANYVEVAKYRGEIADTAQFTDHKTRLSYLDRTMKLLRLNDKDTDNSRIGTINVIINNVNRPDDAECNAMQEAEFEVQKSNASH